MQSVGLAYKVVGGSELWAVVSGVAMDGCRLLQVQLKSENDQSSPLSGLRFAAVVDRYRIETCHR